MKTTAIGLQMAMVLALIALANTVSAADEPGQPIYARDLKTLQIPGRVAGVVWTVRPERCTLQIVFPNAGRIAQVRVEHPRSQWRPPVVQAWLLRADGTAISWIGRFEPGDKAKNPRQPFGEEVLIAFPREAGQEAVAVALRVDDQYLIERLPPGAV